LTAIPGTVVYHLLVFVGLLSAAGIVLTEWRHTHSAELRPYLVALGGALAIHLLSVLIAPLHLQTNSVLALASAPFLYAGELLSILLIVWAFGQSLWGKHAQTVLVGVLIGWAGLWVIASLLWYLKAVDQPISYSVHSWQVPVWYLFVALVAFGGTLLFFRTGQQSGLVPVVFVLPILGVGALLGILGSPVLGPLLLAGEGLARLCFMVAYPLFAISLYSSALQDLATYRQDLQELSQEALRQSQELLFLIEATRSIGERLDLRGMLGRVADSVAMALSADTVAILLADPQQRGVLNLVALFRVLGGQVQLPKQGQPVPLRDYAVLSLALRDRQLVFGPTSDVSQLRSLFDLLGMPGEGPVLIQPLARQDRMMGVLVACNSSMESPFTPEQQRLATTIGVQIAGAVENSQLYNQLEDKAQELGHLLKVREAELRREDAILESMAEGILVSDPEGRFILLNQAAEEILGVERADVLGQNLQQALSAPALQAEMNDEMLLTLSEPFETTFNLEERRVRVHAAPVLLEDDTRLGIVAILQDITREYLAEEAKREFIASISHELRTPLTAIKGYTEVMLSGMAGEMSPAFTQFLSVIRENTTRMASLTNNIISVAEIERGRVGLNYQEIAVSDLVQEMVKRYRERIEERQLSLDLDIPDELPTIEADPNRLRLILDNLLSNAIKFTYPNGEVTVGCRAIYGTLGQPTYFSIWVSDTGVGIPVDEQPYIWDRFYRVDNPLSLEAGGLGIGLTITKALVEAHGGRVWVDSSLDHGSTFTVLLPMQRGQGMTGELEVIL
jgi:PAS domain S-box-containing protein